MDSRSSELTRERAAGMTVNERLYVAGISDEFYAAAEKKDAVAMRTILNKLFLGEQNIEAILVSILEKK
jgi:hypothetical protein